MYPVTEAPPLCEGADHESCTCASPATATGVPGRLGTAEGIAVAVALAAPTPAKVIALTRTEYLLPFMSPPTTAPVAGPAVSTATIQVEPSIDVSMRYPLIAAPPFEEGAVHVSDNCWSAEFAMRFVGAEASPRGCTATGTESTPAAPAAIAATRNA